MKTKVLDKTQVEVAAEILKNGGVYERTFEFENQPADVYRITL